MRIPGAELKPGRATASVDLVSNDPLSAAFVMLQGAVEPAAPSASPGSTLAGR